jgi:Transglycosylase SLT domain
MPKFHSLRPVYPPRIDDEPREPLPASRIAVAENPQDIFNQEIELTYATVTPASFDEQYWQAKPASHLSSVQPAQSTSPRVQVEASRYTAPQVKAKKALQPLQSTQALQSNQPHSLLAALQLTMEPKTNRLPLLIPAEMKRTREQPVTEQLSPGTRRIISRFKLGIVLGAMVTFTLLTVFSFGSANQGNPTLPLINNLIQLSQQGANTALSQTPAQSNPQPVAVDPGIPNIPRSDLVQLAQQDATKYGISPVYFVRQIYAESGFNPNAYSPAGAIGIAQFTPSTAASLGVNPYDPVSSLDGAAKFMARLSNSYGGDYAKALAAYNAGSGAVNNAVSRGGANWLSFMPYETQAYIQKIMG